jgi:hypothetical protein
LVEKSTYRQATPVLYLIDVRHGFEDHACKTMRVLVIEDDNKIASFVLHGLKEAGFAVDHAANGVEGLDLALTAPYDAAVRCPDDGLR